jgi:putative phage-type endonuclease
MAEEQAGADRAAWLAFRREGVGGSDIAAVCGLHPYKTAHEVWMQKVGLAGDEPADAEAARWGRALEPVIAEEYAAREGVLVERFDPPVMLDPRRPWMRGTPDYRVKEAVPGVGLVGLDCKFPGWRQAVRWGEAGSDNVPEEALCQAQWYLALYPQAARWDVAALLGHELRVYRVYPDAALQAALIAKGEEFWTRYVLPRVPPPPDASEGARRAIEALYPREEGQVRQASPEEERLLAVLRAAKDAKAEAEEHEAALQNALRYAIGPDAGLEGVFGKVTWRRAKDGAAVDWEAVAREVWNDYAALRMAVAVPRVPPEEDTAPLRLEDVAARYTRPRPGGRRFHFKWDQAAGPETNGGGEQT